MSWDLFVLDLPPQFSSAGEIPHDFAPKPIGPRAGIIEAICALNPQANFSDPTWGLIDGPDYSIEVSIGREDPVTSFAFHVRGGDQAMFVVADILDRLKLRAFDPQSDTGIFSLRDGMASLQKWRAYRDRVIDKTE